MSRLKATGLGGEPEGVQRIDDVISWSGVALFHVIQVVQPGNTAANCAVSIKPRAVKSETLASSETGLESRFCWSLHVQVS